MSTLSIQNLHVSVEGKKILKGVDLTVNTGEIHALMGPNGSGKSTLASALLGHPLYHVTKGTIAVDGSNITEDEPHERAQAGLFLAFQYPVAVPGVPILSFLRSAYNSVYPEERMSLPKFKAYVLHEAEKLGMNASFLERPVNDGFSGGEKKKAEILQMAVLRPHIAILDETDSGLDVDALKAVALRVNRLVNNDLGILIITHYQRILQYIKPNFVHVMKGGRIVESGGAELAARLEKEGYEKISNS